MDSLASSQVDRSIFRTSLAGRSTRLAPFTAAIDQSVSKSPDPQVGKVILVEFQSYKEFYYALCDQNPEAAFLFLTIWMKFDILQSFGKGDLHIASEQPISPHFIPGSCKTSHE